MPGKSACEWHARQPRDSNCQLAALGGRRFGDALRLAEVLERLAVGEQELGRAREFRCCSNRSVYSRSVTFCSLPAAS